MDENKHRFLVRVAVILTVAWVGWTFYDSYFTSADPYANKLSSADRFFEDGRYAKALDVCDEILDRDPENIDALVAGGAEIVYVSPLKDSELPALDALYIGGGFPETHAEQLSTNTRFNSQLKALAEDGFPIYAECGGLMYLGEQLVLENKSYPMVGILPVTFDFFKRPQGHGYSIIKVEGQNPYYEVGSEIRGHEFHYSRVSKRDSRKSDLVFRMQRGAGIEKDRDGILYKNVLATYTHVHALGTPEWAPALIRNAIKFKKR